MQTVSPVMTQGDWLKLAQSRLDTVIRYDGDNQAEINRLTAVVADIRSKMSDDELAIYNARQDSKLSPEELEKIIKAMNENRDKPSI